MINTKEDIYEFFVFAKSNLTASEEESSAWFVKLEQAYQKARISFGRTQEFKYIDELYSKVSKDYKKRRFTKIISKNFKILLSIGIGVLALTMVLVGFFKGSESGDSDSPYYAMSCIGMILMCAPIFILVDNNKK